LTPPTKADAPGARLFHGDALDAAAVLAREGARADLVYVDPPFGVGKVHGARRTAGQSRASNEAAAYYDAGLVGDGLESFLEMLMPRLAAMHALLSARGTLYVHLDHRSVHHVKVRADEAFGRASFRGEIIWSPGNGARSRTAWGATHQTILVYSRDGRPTPKPAPWIFHADAPELREPYAEGSAKQHFRSTRDADGNELRVRERTVMLKDGPKTYRYPIDRGRRLGTVWTDVSSMSANTPLSPETTGYPHQKPLALLRRIVAASSDPDSLVVDLFAGSGSTLVAALDAGRRAIGCDASPVAIETIERRLVGRGFGCRIERLSSAADATP
jgi:site-specific DNA-methyltransferase (adenine-specific)